MPRIRLLVRLLPLALLVSCMDLDPFGVTERSIIGQYRLKQWEDGSYLFLTPADTGSTYYVQVTRLGWNRTHIVAELVPNGPDYPGGWTVVEAATGRTIRLDPSRDIAADSVATRVPTFRADSAWDRLAR